MEIVSEHGCFAYDDRNVLLIPSNPKYKAPTCNDQVETRQIAPTIVKALGLDANLLSAAKVRAHETLPRPRFTQK